MKETKNTMSNTLNVESPLGSSIIRFGIMCTETKFPAWQAACLQKLLDLGYVEPALLIIKQDSSSTSIWRKLRKLTSNSAWHLFSRLCVSRRSQAVRPVDMSSSLAQVPFIRSKVIKKGEFSQYFSDNDILKIRNHKLDFILRFGFGIIRGEVLNSTRFGVWSFHHGDEQKYRGTPPGFWEIYKGDSITGAILQRLTDRLDGGIVLKKGFFKTDSTSYTRNRDTIFLESVDWPAQVCIDIRNGCAHYLDNSPSKTSAPIFHEPSNRQMFVFIVKVMTTQLRELYKRLLFYKQWAIGVVDQPIHMFVTPGARPRVQWLPNPHRSKYMADPFAIQQSGHLYVLFEDFDFRTDKGCISTIQITGTSVQRSKLAVNEPFHMSYPYLLRHEGEIYCVPETSMAKQVRLYKAKDFPQSWVYVGTLIEGVAALDSTIFHHDGRWWLFATDQDDGRDLKLRVWHADELFGPWKPHANNPVKVDIRSARPAGTPYIYNGELYRPSQDDSETYGGRIVINRVLRLTPTEFEEEQVAVIEPYKNSAYPDGLHTLCSVGDTTLIDGARYLFAGKSPTVLMRKLRAVIILSNRQRVKPSGFQKLNKQGNNND